MSTAFQLARFGRGKRVKKNRRLALQKCPQKKGICRRVMIRTPRKPNSARRKIARVLLLSNSRLIDCFIPGIGHTLQQFSRVLVRGGRVKDLPGMKYKAIRGKFDLRPLRNRRQRRSVYAIRRVMVGLA